MADIAILVAEEYERRVKNSRKVGEEVEFNLVSPVLEMAVKVKNKIRQQNMEMMKWVLEPKSQFGVGEEVEFNLVSHVLEMAVRVKNKIRPQNMEMMKWVLVPKSQFGVAASDGFFSA